MSSAEYLREFVNERLTAAAQEIFRVVHKTIVEYEEEIDRQRRLLEIVWKPEIRLHRIELPQQHVCKEEEVLCEQQLCIEERNSSVDQEEPEPPQIKEEEEEVCSSQEGEQLVLKQETDASMLTPTDEERDHSEDQTLNFSPDDALRASDKDMLVKNSVVSAAHSHHQLLSHNSHDFESRDQTGAKRRDSGSTRKAEPKPKRRRHKSRSHSNNTNNPIMPEIQPNTPSELPQQHVCKEEEVLCEQQLCIEERNSSVDQEEPEPPQIKEEQEEVCISQEGEQLELKQETDASMLTPTDEERDHSEGQTLDFSPGDALRASDKDMPVINSVVSAAHSHHQLLSHNSLSDLIKQTGENLYHCKTGGIRSYEMSVPKSQTEAKNPHSCFICGEDFKCQSHLKAHMRVHANDKPFSCNTCGERFKYKRGFSVHMKQHAGEKPFFCETCGKGFNYISTFMQHMTIHTGEKLYGCETCGKAFRRKDTLVFHTRRVHTGERPHRCDTCGKTFFDRSSLNAHVKTHTDKRPFSCSTCGKGFKTKKDLKVHVTIHTGEKLLPCKT